VPCVMLSPPKRRKRVFYDVNSDCLYGGSKGYFYKKTTNNMQNGEFLQERVYGTK